MLHDVCSILIVQCTLYSVHISLSATWLGVNETSLKPHISVHVLPFAVESHFFLEWYQARWEGNSYRYTIYEGPI